MKKTISVFLSIITAIAILTGSIAVPIIFRPFYYAHIAPLNLSQYGLNETEIKDAFDDAVDFCLGFSDEFSVGKLPFSEEGAAHFADVRAMCIADMIIFAVCVLIILALKALKYEPYSFSSLSPAFYAAVGIVVFAIVMGVCVALDFSTVFTVFHKLLFPGKANWIFSPDLDPIINYLPEVFFRNCAILIFSLTAAVSVLIMVLGAKKSQVK